MAYSLCPLRRPNAGRHNPDPDYLRALIVDAGLSVQDAARRIGISENALRSHLEGESDPAPFVVQYALEMMGAASWIKAWRRLPESGRPVLACYRHRTGRFLTIRAVWIAAHSIEAAPDTEISDYDAETDVYYEPEGWYESVDHWDERTLIAVPRSSITHWMHLPETPGG